MNKGTCMVVDVLATGFFALAGISETVWAADKAPPTGTVVVNNSRSATNMAKMTLKFT